MSITITNTLATITNGTNIYLQQQITTTSISNIIETATNTLTSWSDPALIIPSVGSLVTSLITIFVALTGWKAYQVYKQQLIHNRMETILELLIEFQATEESSHFTFSTNEPGGEHRRKIHKMHFIHRLGRTCFRACYTYYHILKDKKEFEYFEKAIQKYIVWYIELFSDLRAITSSAIIMNEAFIRYCDEHNIDIPIEYKQDQTNKNNPK